MRPEAAEVDADGQHGHAPGAPAPGTLALNARETAAGRAANGSAARVMRFERGWKQVVAVQRHDDGRRAARASAGHAVSPKCAWTTSKRRRAIPAQRSGAPRA